MDDIKHRLDRISELLGKAQASTQSALETTRQLMDVVKPDVVPCARCGGTGWVPKRDPVEIGDIFCRNYKECPACRGAVENLDDN